MERAISAPIPVERKRSAETRAPAHLSGRWLRLAQVTWFFVAALALGILIASLPGHVLLANKGFFPGQSQPLTSYEKLATLLSAILSLFVALAHLALAVLLMRYRSHERMAMVASFYLLVNGIVNVGPLEVLELSLTGSADFVQRTVQPALATTLTIAFLSLFPDGRFVPRWTRWITLLTTLTLPVPFFVDIFTQAGKSILFTVVIVGVAGSIYLAALYAQIYRYRHVSSPTERQQTKWVVYGFGMLVVFVLVSSIPYGYFLSRPAGIPLPWWYYAALFMFWWPAMFVLPITLSIAILRYRLWDIDILINRTLVYGSLTAIVVGIYVLVVGSLGTLFQSGGNLVISLAGTGIVAVLFQPLRERLQRGVNRLMFGERDEPFAVLGRLSERLEAVVASQSVLPTILETVAEALKLPYAAIALNEGENHKLVAEYARSSAAHGNPDSSAEVLPLVYQSEAIGQLILARRAPDEPFSLIDRQLIETIARQVGIAAYNVRLTQDLQRSRERLVTTREEERRRLRRDLHDGLGPALAALAFRLDAAYNLIENDPQAARSSVMDLKFQIQTALDDIRRIAYDLRPPALDELGLVGALSEHIAAHNRSSRLQITLSAPQITPQLVAAAEVAAYRIVLEAITNVVRHADARRCEVSLSVHDRLYLVVTDDGRGISDGVRAGVGIRSMRERAEELGGKCVVEAMASGGTRVAVSLPRH